MFERCARRQPETSIAFGFVTFKPLDAEFKWYKICHGLWNDHYGELHTSAVEIREDVYPNEVP